MYIFIMGNIYIFSPFGTHSEYLAQYFNVINRVRCNKNNPRTHHIFSLILKSDKLSGEFQLQQHTEFRIIYFVNLLLLTCMLYNIFIVTVRVSLIIFFLITLHMNTFDQYILFDTRHFFYSFVKINKTRALCSFLCLSLLNVLVNYSKYTSNLFKLCNYINVILKKL